MTENNSSQNSMEAFPIPEGAILLEQIKSSESKGFVIAALKQILKDRNLDLPMGPQLDLENPERLISFNKFAVQIVTSGIAGDQFSIPLSHWYKSGATPQLILAANVDEENNVVYFPGVITSTEFQGLIANRINGQEEISLSTRDFDGGIDRFLRLVRILQPDSIPRDSLIEDYETEWEWKSIPRILKLIPVGALALGTVLLGPQLLTPRLSGSIASLTPSEIGVTSFTRSLGAEGKSKVCIITPEVQYSESEDIYIALVGVDLPAIVFLDPLNEVRILKDEKVIFREYASLEETITGLLNWPIKYPIKQSGKYEISFRSEGSSGGDWSTIEIQIDPNNKLEELDSLVESLGTDEGKWIRAINDNLESNQSLALTLLFHKSAPQSINFNEIRGSILNREGCLLNEE